MATESPIQKFAWKCDPNTRYVEKNGMLFKTITWPQADQPGVDNTLVNSTLVPAIPPGYAQVQSSYQK